MVEMRGNMRRGQILLREDPVFGPSPTAPLRTLTRMVVTTSVLLASVCDRLISRVVAFMARVRLEYHTPIWG
jgi:hypothetical protein